ncbi:uncharacterized protein LOC113511154 isoform X2 [Galleria mellonella]|nr:uncharacterized protein LOC113511154 isoform X2 [Galleria mellonella]
MLADNSNFEESVAGLFIVYALLNLQPYSGFAALRIVPEDVQSIARLEMVARRERRLDVLYILGSILIKGPCEYHAAVRQYGMEPSYKKYLQGYSDVDRMELRFKGVFFKQPEELDLLRDLAGITSRYVEAKEAILGRGKQLDPNLNFIDKNLPSELAHSLKNVIEGLSEELEESTEAAETEKPSDAHQIKARAMKSTVGQMKHLVGVADKANKTSTKEKGSPRSKNYTEDTDGSTELSSPVSRKRANKAKYSPSPKKSNVDTDSSNKLRKLKKSARSVSAKRKRQKCSSTSSEEDTLLSKLDKSNDDLNLEEFHQQPKTVEKPPEHELDIQIDTIPIFIRTDDNQIIEIEIVDELDRGKNIKSSVKTETVTVADEGECSQVKEAIPTFQESTVGNLGVGKTRESFKKPKRKQVKYHMKSKFKRLGMVPAANFEEDETKGKGKRSK